MSSDGLDDMWLWDDRGDRANLDGSLTPPDKKYYDHIQAMRKVNKCSICGGHAIYRYAPHDGDDPNGTELPYEAQRWACSEHEPYDATDEGWNGEWDVYEWL